MGCTKLLRLPDNHNRQAQTGQVPHDLFLAVPDHDDNVPDTCLEQ
jgi:hypothetical protein